MGTRIASEWRAQPSYPARLNKSHPLGARCVGFWYPVAGVLFDAVDGSIIPPLNSATFGRTVDGLRLMSPSGGARCAIIPSASRWKPTAQISVLKGGLAGTNDGYSWTTENSSDGFGAYSLSHVYLRVGSAWADQLTTQSASSRQFGFTFDGSKFYAVVEGARTNSQSISGSITHSSLGMSLASFTSGASAVANEQFTYLAIFDLALNPGQLKAFFLNPWQVLEFQGGRLAGVQAAAGGSIPYWAFTRNNNVIGVGVN